MTDPRVSLAADAPDGAADQVLAALDDIRPIIRVAVDLTPPAAAGAAALAVMLGRVFPHTEIDGDATLGTNPWQAASVADAASRSASTRPSPTAAPTQDMVIAFGTDAPADLYVGGDDWTMALSTITAQGAIARDSGLGLHAAASYAAAEVKKRALMNFGTVFVPVRDTLVWNLADHRLGPARETPRRRGQPPVVWFGTGSVGSSGAAVTTCNEALTGTAWTVDPDTIDPSRNPYRYPALTGAEEGPKSEWVAHMLASAGWSTHACHGDVAAWIAAQPAPGVFGIAASSVDTVDGRRDVADALAHTTVSVGVNGLALHVQVEHPVDEHACPYCDFVDVRTALEESGLRAELTGIPEHRVIELTTPGVTLTQADVDAAVAAGRVRADLAADLVGRRLDDLIRRVYAQATVNVPGLAQPAAVAAPHVSWLGGVLIAAEIDKRALGLPLLQRRGDVDLAGVPLGVTSTRPRDTTGRCLCANVTRRQWAKRLYT